jgi:hypothetical protein
VSPGVGPHAASRAAHAIFAAVALDGPVSPADFRVLRYEKGSGPHRVPVETGLHKYPNGTASVSEGGILPHRGERFRIFDYGRTDAGAIETQTCSPTRQVTHSVGALYLRARHRTVRAVRSTYHGHGLKHRPHRLRVRRHVRVVVLLKRPAPLGVSVVTARGRLLANARSRDHTDRRFVFRLRGRIRHRRTLVLDTGAAFYAVQVKPRH